MKNEKFAVKDKNKEDNFSDYEDTAPTSFYAYLKEYVIF